MKTVRDGKKKCSCGNWKSVENFHWGDKKKNRLYSWCKECQKQRNKQYRENNKDKIKQQSKQYRENNKDKIKQRYEDNKDKIKQYRENNKDKIKQQSKQYRENNKDKIKQYYEDNKNEHSQKMREYWHSKIKYKKLTKKLENIKKYEKTRESINEYIECTCDYCGDWFEPTRIQISQRLDAIFGYTKGGENRFYCSNECKQNCPIFQYSGFVPPQLKEVTSREVQPQLRQLVFDRDNYTCQKCNEHRDDLDVGLHCHHICGIHDNPIESADMDNCITYCERCHRETHKMQGCGYHDLRVDNWKVENIYTVVTQEPKNKQMTLIEMIFK